MYRRLFFCSLLIFPFIVNSDITFIYRSNSICVLTKADLQHKKNSAVDTAALRQTGWYADVIKNIEASEYEIHKDAKTGMYVAPNRKHQLRATFNYNSFTLQPRQIGMGSKTTGATI